MLCKLILQLNEAKLIFNLVAVVQMLDNVIHRKNLYPVDTKVLTKQTTLSARWYFIQWIALFTFPKTRAKIKSTNVAGLDSLLSSSRT